ncbi:MAG: helix-turn-helix domain-containing protein [Anaerolineae bacterium]|nr:helix-turn-helix domain-containing protein [Anaerolineae bacterium]
MLETKHKQALDLFYEVSAIPLMICQADGSPVYTLPSLPQSDETTVGNHSLISHYLEKRPATSAPMVEILDPVFFYGVIQLDDNTFLILGPAAPIRHDEDAFIKLALQRNVAEQYRKAFCEHIHQIPVISFRRFLITLSLIHYMIQQVMIPPDMILLQQPRAALEMEELLTHTLFEARENKVMHTPSSFEHTILEAVSEGDVIRLKQALHSPAPGVVGRMSNDPVQQEKFTFVSFITLVTRAAIAGGLPPELAYSLSDIYCQVIDPMNDIASISSVTLEMALDFTEKVAQTLGKNRLSPMITAACAYINGHLHENIDLLQLVAGSRVSAKTLSQNFKKETGLSITDYIHRERIKEAQALMRYSNYSITQIGYFLQYASQSYFSSIFKKFTGLTPQQYRRQAHYGNY